MTSLYYWDTNVPYGYFIAKTRPFVHPFTIRSDQMTQNTGNAGIDGNTGNTGINHPQLTRRRSPRGRHERAGTQCVTSTRFEICVISTLVPSDGEHMALIMSQLRIACGYNKAAGSCNYPRPVITSDQQIEVRLSKIVVASLMSATTIFVICSGVNLRPPKIFLDLMPITPLLHLSNRTPPKLRGGSAPDGHLLFYRTSTTQEGPLLRVSTAFPLVKLPLKALENQLNQCYRDTPSRTDRTDRTDRPHLTLCTTQ